MHSILFLHKIFHLNFHFFYDLFLKFLFEFSSIEERYFHYNHSFSRDMNEYNMKRQQKVNKI